MNVPLRKRNLDAGFLQRLVDRDVQIVDGCQTHVHARQERADHDVQRAVGKLLERDLGRWVIKHIWVRRDNFKNAVRGLQDVMKTDVVLTR